MVANKNLCTGCGVCVLKCPMHCIEMKMDEEGFYYPEIDAKKCTNCGLCNKICPVNGSAEKNEVKEIYAFVHKNEEVFKKSSSGGAFSAISEGLFESFDKGCVFGAVMCEDLKCRHFWATSYSEIDKFRKSKYIPSEATEGFKKCKEKLESGYSCVFSGTPCLIGGLKSYLGQEYENLITVDLLCHGVPNNKIWEKYITSLKKKFKADISTVQFRHKKNIKYGKEEKLSSENLLIKTSNGDFSINRHEDWFLRGYHNALFYRKSCYECIYSGKKRVSDMTISDFWKYEELYPESGFDGRAGVSAILVNTPKGQEFLKKIEIEKYAALYKNEEVQELEKRNLPLCKPVKLTKQRAEFFKYLKNHSFTYAVRRTYFKADMILMLKRKLYFVKKFIEMVKRRCKL